MSRQSFALIPISLLALVAFSRIGDAQDVSQKRIFIADFDLRGQAAGSFIHDRALVQRRAASVESFIAAELTSRPGLRVVLNERGLPKLYLRDGGVLSAPSAGPAEESAKAFLRNHASVFQLTGPEIDQLRLTIKDITPQATFLSFTQTVDGIDVFEGQIKFTLTSAGEVVQTAMAEVVPGLSLSTTPRLPPDKAALMALEAASRGRN